jgi:Hypothetical glycosyl hydrolase family 15
MLPALTALLVGAFAVGASSASATTYANFNREAFQYSTTLSTSQEANRYQVMVTQTPNTPLVKSLHAANPSLKILMYQDMLVSRTDDLSGNTVCTDYATDPASWFMTDQHGKRILLPGSKTIYLMDPGSSGYQHACMQHALGLVQQGGFNGVFFDGLASLLTLELPSGTTVPKYSTSSAWQAAVLSFLTYAGSAAHAQHELVFGAIAAATATPGLWAKWSAPIDGSEEESFTDGGLGTAQQIPFWAAKLANVAWSEAHGKYALLHSYNTTVAGNTYGLASMMLVAGGFSSYSVSNANYGPSEAWYPEYATAQFMGAPQGAYQRLYNGAYERKFAHGLVLVNPTSNKTGTFSLGGSYSGSGYNNITSVNMGPATGIILLPNHGGSSQGGTGPSPGTPKLGTPVLAKGARCVTPKLTHLRLTQARRAIAKSHCRVGRISRTRSSRRYHGRVLRQSPRASERLELRSKVNLTIGR